MSNQSILRDVCVASEPLFAHPEVKISNKEKVDGISGAVEQFQVMHGGSNSREYLEML